MRIQSFRCMPSLNALNEMYSMKDMPSVTRTSYAQVSAMHADVSV